MKIILLFCFLILSACGFTPVYAPQSQNNLAQQLNAVEILNIPDRSGQIVHNHLMDRLYLNGIQDSYRYQLRVAPIQERTVNVGIDKDDDASRAQYRVTTRMSLYDTEINKVILTRSVSAVSSYNILSGQFTTFVTREDARRQALRALSDDIVTQLQLKLAS
jgi:LPS-assembly lipoprotein